MPRPWPAETDVPLPRLPDWLVYLAIVTALVIASMGRREQADAPVAVYPGRHLDDPGDVDQV